MNKVSTTKEITNETIGGNSMIKNMRKQLKNEKGLTLIELLAVIVILAIIAAIAIPAIGNIITNSKYNAVKADALNVLSAGQMYYLDNPEEKTGVLVSKLISEKYLETSGKIPPTATVSTTPHALSDAVIKFDGEKTVTFAGATIEGINDNKSKGSTVKSVTITGKVTTEPTN